MAAMMRPLRKRLVSSGNQMKSSACCMTISGTLDAVLRSLIRNTGTRVLRSRKVVSRSMHSLWSSLLSISQLSNTHWIAGSELRIDFASLRLSEVSTLMARSSTSLISWISARPNTLRLSGWLLTSSASMPSKCLLSLMVESPGWPGSGY